MSVVARLEVIPQSEGSMADAVARAVEALDQFDVSYETTPTDTVVEAEDPTEVFAAAEAAHRAVDGERVITSLEVDEYRTQARRGRDRVESVERRLGRSARRGREGRASERAPPESQPTGQSRPTGRARTTGQSQATDPTQTTSQRQPPEPPERYGGPWRSGESTSGGQTATRTSSRYLQSRPVSR